MTVFFKISPVCGITIVYIAEKHMLNNHKSNTGDG